MDLMKETMKKRDDLDEKVDAFELKYGSLLYEMKKGFEDEFNKYVFTLVSNPFLLTSPLGLLCNN